jgi:hypothetical protein
MSKMKIAAFGIVVLTGVTQVQASGVCPAPTVLPILERAYQSCASSRRQCTLFVEAFREVIPRYDCKRDFDTAPVPAIWLAGDRQFEKYVALVARLRTPGARKLFASPEFRSVLDGDVAEQYGNRSRAAERRRHNRSPRSSSELQH